jgi:hypothetical protein
MSETDNKQTTRIIVGLWRLLDDIDTLDDACRDNDKMFREAAYRRQRQRFDVLSGEDFDALRKEMEDEAGSSQAVSAAQEDTRIAGLRGPGEGPDVLVGDGATLP